LMQWNRDEEFARWLPQTLADKTADGQRSTRVRSLRRVTDFWDALSGICIRANQSEWAARCHLESLRINPNNPAVLQGLADVLRRLDRTDDANAFADRAANLRSIRRSLNAVVRQSTKQQRDVCQVVRKMAAIGRERESVLWLQIALRMRSGIDPQIDALRNALAGRHDLPWQRRSKNPVNQINRDDFSMPQLDTIRQHLSYDSSAQLAGSKIRFEDHASRRGLVFATDMGDDPDAPGVTLYQSMGVGVAILDFDADGWPDVSIPDASGTPPRRDSRPGNLFHNLEGRFQSVTDLAGANDTGYGQGVSAGDYNDDGFEDLFICNIGRNTLLRNNGDGTFTDVTNETGLNTLQEWSVSAAIADVNGDGNCDIITVNYCGGPDVYTRQCTAPQINEPRLCAPQTFSGVNDAIWWGRDDGTFQQGNELTVDVP
ncbi:MAG: FG-GAP-like repeat-containing protein, partial [Planctomycetota bacterium]